MHVGGTLVADVRALPQVLHDLAARERALLRREQGEEAELRGREPDDVAVDARLVTREVELDCADAPEGRAAVEPPADAPTTATSNPDCAEVTPFGSVPAPPPPER